jgi:hypothetical protein
MSDPVPVIDLDTEASHVSVQSVPGAVFLRLRRERNDGTVRRMFVELTIDEALLLQRELDLCVSLATANGMR